PAPPPSMKPPPSSTKRRRLEQFSGTNPRSAARSERAGTPRPGRNLRNPLHPPDLTVEGMDGFTALDVFLSQRNNVLDNGLRRRRGTHRRAQATERHAADQGVHPFRLLGRLEPAELL